MDNRKLANVVVDSDINIIYGSWRLSERSDGWHSACREKANDRNDKKDTRKTNYRIINNEKAEN